MIKYLYDRKTIASDAVAGLTLGIESIPDGMAAGLLAAVNPIHGVYGYMVGVFTGAFFTSSVFMSVQSTSAMALIVASVPEARASVDHLYMLAIVTGVFMVVLGLLKMGTVLRFVPKSVMTGFVNAIAVLIILGQLGDLTGTTLVGPNKIAQTINLIFNLDLINVPSLIVGVATIVLIIVLERTRLGSFGLVVALLIASVFPPLLEWHEVALARDIAEIPGQLPLPSIPSLSVIFSVIVPALSLALVGLVQGAGVSQSYMNPDGKYPDASRDFVGQGVANVASGIFQGLPVGGSLSATSIAYNSGAKTRFANITAGLTMAVALLLLGNLIGRLAMPALAGLLIVVGFRTLKPDDLRLMWHSGIVQQIVMLITFVTALLVPLQFAVLMGVAISILLFVFRQSNEIHIKELVYEPGVFPIERDAPETVPANTIITLMPYGSLFFASAQVFEKKLPDVVEETRNSVVILRLRGRSDLGTTFMSTLRRYAEDLRVHNSRLMLTGVSTETASELERTRLIDVFGRENVFLASERLGKSSLEAYEVAEKWLEKQKAGENSTRNANE